MFTIKELTLALTLATLAAAATAGMTGQMRTADPGIYPECRNGVSGDAARSDPAGARSASNDAGAVDEGEGHQGALDEYLSFHAQVTEGSGKFLLMPWPQLRTHAD